MFARLPRLLLALALASSIGLHWVFLQAVAWSGMIVSYAQDAPLTEAVAKTFDGHHPCKLCKKIAREKQAEKKSLYKFEFGKLEFRYCGTAFVFVRPSDSWELPAFVARGELLNHSPPLPPPRVLA